MNDAARPVRKVLVLERDPVRMKRRKLFCDEHDLVGMKVQHDNVMSLLKSNCRRRQHAVGLNALRMHV